MAWPPLLPPAGRSNATPQQDNHPSDHNLIAAALAEMVTRYPAVGWQTGVGGRLAAGGGQLETVPALTLGPFPWKAVVTCHYTVSVGAAGRPGAIGIRFLRDYVTNASVTTHLLPQDGIATAHVSVPFDVPATRPLVLQVFLTAPAVDAVDAYTDPTNHRLSWLVVPA